MPSFLCTNISAAVGGTASIDIIPGAADAYLLKDFFADAVFENDQPDLTIAIRNVGAVDCLVTIDPVTVAQKPRQKEIYIDNTTYVRLTNTAAGNQNLGWTGHQVPAGIVRTDIYTAPTAAPGFVNIRPPEGEVWKVTELGAEIQNATNEQDHTLYLTDGTLVASMMADGARDLVWPKLLNLYLSHDLWLRAEEIGGADNDIAVSAILVAVEHFGAIETLGAGLNLDIQPDDGVEAVITQVSASGWAGAAPAGSPDIFVALYDETSLSDIMEDGAVSDSLIHNRLYEIEIDHDVYIRITEGSAAPNEVAYSGFVRRYYNV